MPLHVPVTVEAPVLEGDYSDWTIYDSFVDPDLWYSPFAYDNYAIINRIETDILLISAHSDDIKKYNIATKTLSDKLFEPDESAGFHVGLSFLRSAYGTYVGKKEFYGQYIKILKDAVVIKTLSDSDLGLYNGGIRACSFSPTGKYFVTGGRDPDNKWKWVVLVGS